MATDKIEIASATKKINQIFDKGIFNEHLCSKVLILSHSPRDHNVYFVINETVNLG